MTSEDDEREERLQSVIGSCRISGLELTEECIITMRGILSGALNADCLLYTSPSPRDATLSRMPSSA